jgi:hypothetical protein
MPHLFRHIFGVIFFADYLMKPTDGKRQAHERMVIPLQALVKSVSQS